MKRLVFLPVIIYAFCITADMASTILCFTQFPNSGLREMNSLGYPLVLIHLANPVLAFLASAGIARIKNPILFIALASALAGLLTVLSIGPLRAASSNMNVYNRLNRGG